MILISWKLKADRLWNEQNEEETWSYQVGQRLIYSTKGVPLAGFVCIVQIRIFILTARPNARELSSIDDVKRRSL